MKTGRYSFIDVILWGLVVYLTLYIPHIEMRVEEYEQMAPREQPPASTAKPEPIEQYLNMGKCFHMGRPQCPQPQQGCSTVGAGAVFCCDLDGARLRDTLSNYLITEDESNFSLNRSTTKYLHVLNATIEELDISQAMFKRLTSMAFTDGNIGKIVRQFPKQSSIACLNISHNNLTSVGNKLSSTSRPFAYVFNLTVLDASANNLTEFPLSLVHSNKNISVDLSGNNFLPCKHFQKAMETNNSSLVNFINYDNTFCALDLKFNWFNEYQVVPIDYLRVQKELNVSCRNIKPTNINCTCVPDVVKVVGKEVTRLVAVDCSSRQLTEMPTDLPPNTVQLNVSYNNITSLQAVSDDPSYDTLRRLVVDHNDIVNILELEGTKFIDHFMLFSIGWNKLKTIHTYVLSNRFDSTGPAFSIAGNSIHCDCNTEKMLKPWLLENAKNIPDYKSLMCQGMGAVVDLVESEVCHTPRDWTDYIYYIIGLEVLILVLLVSKVSYDYWVFKTAGYLPWPANKMPRLPCDWLCE